MAKKATTTEPVKAQGSKKSGDAEFELGETVFCMANSDVSTIIDDLSKDWSAWSRVPVPKK